MSLDNVVVIVRRWVMNKDRQTEMRMQPVIDRLKRHNKKDHWPEMMASGLWMEGSDSVGKQKRQGELDQTHILYPTFTHRGTRQSVREEIFLIQLSPKLFLQNLCSINTVYKRQWINPAEGSNMHEICCAHSIYASHCASGIHKRNMVTLRHILFSNTFQI